MQREAKNQNNYENVYTLRDLEEPSAKGIRELDQMLGERRNPRVASGAPSSSASARNTAAAHANSSRNRRCCQGWGPGRAQLPGARTGSHLSGR